MTIKVKTTEKCSKGEIVLEVILKYFSRWRYYFEEPKSHSLPVGRPTFVTAKLMEFCSGSFYVSRMTER